MTIELREYQREAVDAVFAFWGKGGGNPLVEIATGGGKSLVLAECARRLAQDHGARVVLATHRKELIEQDAAAVRKLWPAAPVGIWSASVGQRRVDRITVCGVQSVWRQVEKLGRVDVLAVDEAHLVSPSGLKMYTQTIAGLRERNPEMRLLGMTATPFRVGQGMLTQGDDRIFDAVVYRAGMRKLVDAGYLSPLVSGGASLTIDTSKVATQAGEFVISDLELACDVEEISETVARDLAATGRKSILVFGVTVAHAMNLANALRFAGIECETAAGDMDKARRADVLRRFKAGELRAIASCEILTTGFDAPNVDAIAVVRPTRSPGLWVQIAGRGSRLSPGKTDCLVLDYGGNIARHGPVDDVTPPKAPRPKVGESMAIPRVCPECYGESPRASPMCVHCDFEFPPPERKPKVADRASTLPVMSAGGERLPPERRTHRVEETSYAEHTSNSSGSRSLRVDYRHRDTIRPLASEWLCFDHDPSSFAFGKAAAWWHKRTGKRPPESVDEALARVHELPTTTTIDVERDGKFWRVISAQWTHAPERATETTPPADNPHGITDDDDFVDELWGKQ